MLICPACQAAFDWMADLDRCPVCTGIRLVRRLGEVECRDCGSVGQPAAATSSSAGVTGLAAGAAAGPDEREGPAAPGLAEEVELALARVLGRAGRPAGIG